MTSNFADHRSYPSDKELDAAGIVPEGIGRKALIIVDVQNDFIDGSLPVKGGADVATRIRDLVINGDEGNAVYDYIVTTQDWHVDPGDHWSKTPDFTDTWPIHGMVGTRGAELHDELKDLNFDAKFFKGQRAAAYSGFEGTTEAGVSLGKWLNYKGVTTVDVVGLAFDYCVASTASDAAKLGLDTTILMNLTASVNLEHAKGVAEVLVADGVKMEGYHSVPVSAPVGGVPSNKDQLIELLTEVGGRYREEPVHLATGEDTHVYLDVKGVLDRGSRINLAADAMIDHMMSLAGWGQVTAIGGPTMGADVLAHAIVGREFDYFPSEDLKWFAVRDHAKTDHGLGKLIEGAELGPDDYVILTDDVANSGKSLLDAYKVITKTGAHVVAIMPLVDRSDKTEKLLRAEGRLFTKTWPELEGVPYLPLITSDDLGLEPLK